METPTIEGESPVCEILKHPRGIPSNAGHGKFRVNPVRPWTKPKYENLTDRELVPRGNVEKNPGEGSEIDLKPSAYIQWELYGDTFGCRNE